MAIGCSEGLSGFSFSADGSIEVSTSDSSAQPTEQGSGPPLSDVIGAPVASTSPYISAARIASGLTVGGGALAGSGLAKPVSLFQSVGRSTETAPVALPPSARLLSAVAPSGTIRFNPFLIGGALVGLAVAAKMLFKRRVL